MSGWYDMDGEPMDLMAWSEKYKGLNRRVAYDDLDGGVRISTVLLGLDHSFGSKPPVIFETLVFGGPMDGEMDRYCTRDEAVKGHAAMLARVAAAMLAEKGKGESK